MAMNFIGKIYEFYKDLNPNTLTGAVDVVVVEDVKTGRLTCSPFHVRFGKLQILRPSEKKVEIEINGRPVDEVSMKIGLAGETFFVIPVDGPVPWEYQTSPLPTAIQGSPQDVPKISLTSPEKKTRIEPLSDSELETGGGGKTGKLERRRLSKAALSDSEIETGSAAAGSGTGGGDDLWTWKWGDLPTREDRKEGPITEGREEPNVPLAVVTEVEQNLTKMENEILGMALEEPPKEPLPKESLPPLVLISDYLMTKETITMMYSRLEEIIAEGLDDLELCLFRVDKTKEVRPSDLTMLKTLSASLETVTWDQFQADPEATLESSVICVFGASTKCALFPTRGALQLLIGLRLYKQLFPLERLISLIKLNTEPSPTTASSSVAAGKGESILSWRQWWSSPRSQSAKAVPASPTKNTNISSSSPSKTSPSKTVVVSATTSTSNSLTVPTSNSVPVPISSPAKQENKKSAINAVASIDTTTGTTTAIPRTLSSPDIKSDSINYAKSLRLPTGDLRKLGLHYGMNTISFSVITSKNGKATCAARIFLWRSDEKIVISDIDGTITKSDALGHLFQIVGKDWTHMGVANLYTDIARNGYRFLYLTSRPIGQATQTRTYLRGVEQDQYQLPEGPVIMSPDRFFMAMRREVIEGNPEQFKIPCLLDVRRLFYPRPLEDLDPMALNEEERKLTSCPFYAGFGNRNTDAVSYQAVGINPARIYIINPAGDLSLQIITGYRSSYVKLVDLVDNVFPPINAAIERDRAMAEQLKKEQIDRARKMDEEPIVLAPAIPPRPIVTADCQVESEEFNDFFFWKPAIPLPPPADSLFPHHLSTSSATSPDLLPPSNLPVPLLVEDNLVKSGLVSSNGLRDDDGQEDETGSERGDHYYFDEREEAGLIPFA